MNTSNLLPVPGTADDVLQRPEPSVPRWWWRETSSSLRKLSNGRYRAKWKIYSCLVDRHRDHKVWGEDHRPGLGGGAWVRPQPPRTINEAGWVAGSDRACPAGQRGALTVTRQETSKQVFIPGTDEWYWLHAHTTRK